MSEVSQSETTAPTREAYPPLEVVTRCDLSDEVLVEEARAIVPMLRALGIETMRYECHDGWAWVPIENLPGIIGEGLGVPGLTRWKGTYSPMDQTFVAQDPRLDVEFCHDAQVHVRAHNPMLIATFWDRWKQNDLAFGRRSGDEWTWEDA